jgi:hypothetical protein
VPCGNRPGRHQGGRIMRSKNARISGEASSSASRRILSRLFVTVTIAGPVMAAAFAFFRGARLGLKAWVTMRVGMRRYRP